LDKIADFRIARLGVQALAEMPSPQAWDTIDKLRNSPDYAVCMEARRACFNRLHQPLMAKDECPMSNPRKK